MCCLTTRSSRPWCVFCARRGREESMRPRRLIQRRARRLNAGVRWHLSVAARSPKKERLADVPRSGFLFALHFVCAIAAGVFFLALEPPDGGVLRTLGFRGGLSITLLSVLPAIWPFIVSYALARARVPYRGRGLALFSTILVAVATLGVVALRALPREDVGALASLAVSGVQVLALWGSILLVQRKQDDASAT